LFRLPEVFSLAEEAADLDGVWAVMAAALDQALREVLTMRETEGENLRRDLLGRTRLIEDFVETIAGRARDVPAEHAQRMRKRLSELLPDSPLDDVRLAQEVAIFADRASIDEEVVRLRSHLQQFTALLAGGGAVGRKADFVVQEMFRETNTIGSKANDSIIAGLVVEVKAELERVREQLQNIE
ncbi:MAG: DUF1732 domain-containing protein, partial [Syntrophomonadaceae bacterium]|nr:DUF1732 domain-containing protein [Syntrophomonadaceae bacterium]